MSEFTSINAFTNTNAPANHAPANHVPANLLADSLSPFDSLQRHLRVVLVEPAGGLNVGAIARVMKNMGLSRLVVVKPKCDVLGSDARQMAVHALDVLESATIVTTIPDALQGCQRVVATSARDRDLAIPVDAPTAGLQWLLAPLWAALASTVPTANATAASPPVAPIDVNPIDVNPIDVNPIDIAPDVAPNVIAPDVASNVIAPDVAMMFGPEDRGLSNAELIHAQRLVMIPSSPIYASLNLAQAVAICCYEVYRLAGVQGVQLAEEQSLPPGRLPGEEVAIAPPSSPPPSHHPTTPPPHHSLAPVDALEGFYQQLETVLLDIGYLYPHTVQRRMEKFRLLFNRTQLTENEVAMLRGILRQMAWAARSPQP